MFYKAFSGGSARVYSIHRPDINLAEGKPYIATVKLLNF